MNERILNVNLIIQCKITSVVLDVCDSHTDEVSVMVDKDGNMVSW